MRTKIIVGIVVVIIAAIVPFVFLFGGGLGEKERLIKDVSYIGFKQEEWLFEEFTTKPEEAGWTLAYELKADNETTQFTAYLLECDALTFSGTLITQPPSEWADITVWTRSGGSEVEGESVLTGEITGIEGSKTYTFVFKTSISSLGAYKLTLERT